jgi:hypothetical protein
VLDISIDKPKQVEGYVGPMVQIGLNLGGMKQLATPSVTTTPSKSLPSVQVENQESPSTSTSDTRDNVINGEEV